MTQRLEYSTIAPAGVKALEDVHSASALDNLNSLKQLAHSPHARDRAIHGKILKNAAILQMLTARRGPYKTWSKASTTAKAI